MWAATETLNVEGLTDRTAVGNLINNGWTSGNITISFSKNNSSTGGNHFEGNDSEAGTDVKNIKWRYADGKSTMTITSAEGFLVTQVKLYMYEVQYGITTTPTSTRTSGTDGSYKTETFDISENTQTVALLKKGQNKNNHILKIEVTYAADNRTDFGTFRLNRDEALYSSPDLFVGRQNFNKEDSDPFEFLFDSNKTTLKTKVNLTDGASLLSYNATSDNFTIESSDPTVINVSSSTISEPSAGRLYFDNLQVLKAGTTTLTYKFLGSSSHKKAEFSVTVNVKEHLTTFDNSYPYTWDFNNGDWSTSMIWMDYYASTGTSWTTTKTDGATEARPTSNSFVGDDNVDIIKGLTFNVNNTAGSLCLDWFTGRQSIWMANGTSFTIPNVPAGYIVKIKADGTSFTGSSNCIKNYNTLTVNTTGDVTVTMTADTRIFSIYAGPELEATWSYTPNLETIAGDTKARATSGTFTFTGEGKLTGGTIIDEVPGITMTVGRSEDTWEVVEGVFTDGNDSWNLGYAASCSTVPGPRNDNKVRVATEGCFYTFTATVNGEVSVRYYTVLGASVIDVKKTSEHKKNTTNRIQEITFTVEAGKSYQLHMQMDANPGNLYLHSFTFTPKFFAPGTTTDQLTKGKFEAHVNDPAISAFPKLIDRTNEAQQNRVKFAGDKTIVHLYKNNDVEIIGTGTDVLIRGTVLDKNNEDGLVAYYYLDSYVLKLVSSELDDQAYINANGLGADNNYTFTFSGNIASAADASVSTVMVKVKTDAQNEVEVGANISGATLNINFGDLSSAEGSTYRITIPANVVALEGDAATKNSEIIRTFSVNKAEELQVKMVYPTDIATVGTTIVLETYVDGSTSGLTLNDGAKVKAVLSAEGETDMEIDATFSGNHLSFKPTHTLTYNKDYTLTYTYNATNNVITSQPVSDKIYKVTHNKVFTFTTGSSSGTAPKVATTSPTANAVIPGSAYSGGRISFTFDQTVDLEPFSTVTVTPVNGSEATTTASTHAPGAGGNTLLVDSDGKTVYFNYNADGVKYDLYYQVVIPANTVVGVGGLPNSEPITLNFRMGKNPKATEVDPDTFYPHTWDFTNLSPTTITGFTTSKETVGSYTSATTGFLWKDDAEGFVRTYSNTGRNQYLDQGNELSYTYISNNTQVNEKVAEMKGLRISMMSNRTDQLRIRTSSSEKYYLHLNGGTNYMTVPTMKAGKKLYIRAKANGFFRINSVNQAKFTMGNADADGQIAIADGTDRTYVVELKDGYDNEDVIFCTDNVTFYKMAVPIMERTVNQFMDEDFGYITDCQYVPVTYSLTGDFLDSGFEALYIQGSSYNDQSSSVSTTKITADANGNIAVPANVGVLLKAAKGSTLPVFRADINTTGTTLDGNLLKAVPESGITFAAVKAEADAANAVNFIYTNMYKKLDENGNPIGDKMGGTTNAYGFYKWVSGNGTKNRAYLQMPKAVVLAKPYIFIDFEEDISTSIERVKSIENKVSNDAPMYNLSGQRVGKDYKGIVVVNGRKIWRK